jgi:small GTP-binding protein
MSNQVTLLTAPGTSAIAVIRLTGPGVDAFLAHHFSKPMSPNRCIHGLLRDGERVIDDIVAVRSADFVDLNLHGGSYVVRSAMELAQRDGFEISDAPCVEGDTELWREVAAALPGAKTEEAVRILLAQPAAWGKLLEACDPNSTTSDRAKELQKILNDTTGRWLINVPTVAIVGPANVGKSTLANQLFGQARSITADLPGTTRDWVGEIANIDGVAVMLLDTPGERRTDDAIEHAALLGSREQIRAADLVILVLDQSQPINEELLARYPCAIRVANKSDQPPMWDARCLQAIQTVATDGSGVDDLRTAIRAALGFETMELNRVRWWTERQRRELDIWTLQAAGSKS